MRRVADYVLDAEKQGVDVEVEFLDPDDIRDLLAGYSADVEIILDVRKDTLRVQGSPRPPSSRAGPDIVGIEELDLHVHGAGLLLGIQHVVRHPSTRPP